MVVNTQVKLEAPAELYGAVYGRNQKGQNKRYVILALAISLWISVLGLAIYSANTPAMQIEFFKIENGFSVLGLSIAVLILGGLFGFFGGIQSCLGYNATVFGNDVYEARAKWATTVFHKWFEQRYAVTINSNEALNLLDGHTIRLMLWDDETKRSERVTVEFDYNPEFARFSAYGKRSEGSRYASGEFPDVSQVEFNLMVIEIPSAPRRYMWS